MGSDGTRYWFKRRRYGWGYTPVAWQGWLAVVLLLVLTLAPTLWIGDAMSGWVIVGWLAWIVVVLAGFVALTFRTGPPARWRWGRSVDDDPAADW